MTLILFFSLLMFQQMNTSEEVTTSITVVVENLKSTDGTVLVALYSEETFMKAAPEKSISAKIVDGKATVTFEGVEKGIYGITVVHDKNGNNKMDFDNVGMPLEDYGISNNKFNPYGPPVWSDARFEVADEPLDLHISVTR